MKVGQEQGEMKVVFLLWILREVQKESHCKGASSTRAGYVTIKLAGQGSTFAGSFFQGSRILAGI